MPGGKRKASNMEDETTTIATNTTRTESDQPLTKKSKTKKEGSKKRKTIQMEIIENPKTKKRLRKEDDQIDNAKVIKSKTIKKKTKKKVKTITTSTISIQPADHENGGKLGHDMWRNAALIGTRWDELLNVRENHINWEVDFSNLEQEFQEGGKLYNQFSSNKANKLYLFIQLDPASASDPSYVPVVVAIVSPHEPSRKLAISSIQSAQEQIIPMEDMYMDWCPRHFHDWSISTFVLEYKSGIVQHCQGELDEDNILTRLEYCLPYVFNPEIEEENLKKQNTCEVDIMFAQEPSLPVMCVFDWEIDQLEDFANDLIEEGELCADRKDEFKEYVRGQVREAKRKIKELTSQVVTEEARAAFESMRFYKFYPKQTSGAPQFQRDSTINRYYGKAHEVL